VLVKTVRPIPIADPLWDALERMAVEMGTDVESVVNQAIHAWGRQNGFVLPGGAEPPAAPPGAGPSPGAVGPERREAARRVLEAAAALEDDIAGSDRTPTGELASEPGTLYVVGEGGEILKVGKDRFLVGRGKHCDLVVESGKVSREHAAIVREPDGWYLQDLGSANGTWFQRARIDRRRIEDGDEFFICSEKIRCVLR
jgi:hypothetical protein